MATTIVVTCPECKKQMKASDELAGKKIRCKGCDNVFAVKVPGAKSSPAAKPAAKDKATAIKSSKAGDAAKPEAAKFTVKKKKRDDDDDYGPANPYAVTHLDLTPRCPHCANELEAADSVICLHCGYNTLTREQFKTVKTIDLTTGDWIRWWLPVALCVFVFFAMVGTIIFIFVMINGILDEYPDEWWSFGASIFKIWGSVFCLFVMFFTGRFAIKRGIFHPRPVEKVKEK